MNKIHLAADIHVSSHSIRTVQDVPSLMQIVCTTQLAKPW